MKLTAIERFEIEASAFHAMTHYMAPGKDVADSARSHSYEERMAAWEVWCQAHGAVIDAVLNGVELTLEDVTDAI